MPSLSPSYRASSDTDVELQPALDAFPQSLKMRRMRDSRFDLSNLWTRSWRASKRGESYSHIRSRSSSPLRWRRHGRLFRSMLYTIYAIIAFVLLSLLNGILRPSYLNPPAHYGQLARQIQDSEGNGRGNSNNQKVFIAANIINQDLIRGSWGESLLELVDVLGSENVFVSIHENDAGNGTRDALMTLREKLPCNSSIVAGDHMSLADFPTISLPINGDERTKRLIYLAEVRNRAILPLQSGPEIEAWASTHPTFTQATTRFDRVLFLNDIFFKPVEAAQLLFSTNEGKYDAACAIDFVAKVMFYDTFVVHDTEGYGMGLMFYPWFSTSGSSTSRNDVLSQTDAVRVRSCWGGMAAFDASIFQAQPLSTPLISSSASEQQHQNPLPVDRSNSTLALPGLTFRSILEPFWEEAECCLLFADLEIRRAALRSLPTTSPANAPLSAGVFINPYIRVAYSSATWDWLPFMRRYERLFQFLQYWVSKTGYPEFNPRRTHEAGKMAEEKVWVPIDGHVAGGKWEVQSRVADAGGWCGQRRMFVMKGKGDLEEANRDGWGKNWEKVKVPSG